VRKGFAICSRFTTNSVAVSTILLETNEVIASNFELSLSGYTLYSEEFPSLLRKIIDRELSE